MSHHTHGGCGGTTGSIEVMLYNGIIDLLPDLRLWIHRCDTNYGIPTSAYIKPQSKLVDLLVSYELYICDLWASIETQLAEAIQIHAVTGYLW